MAKLGIKFKAEAVAVSTLEETALLDKTIPMLILGERNSEELKFLVEYNAAIQVQSLQIAESWAKLTAKHNKLANVHLKIDTGLGRYGINPKDAVSFYHSLLKIPNLKIKGIMSHLAMSDELDKSYAKRQFKLFNQAINKITMNKKERPLLHICNSGGYLDLPKMHLDLCRVGILLTGNYPSKVCRRINIKGEELISPFKLSSKIIFLNQLQAGDHIGYGMHYQASRSHKIGIVPVGHGDGYPRLRNSGFVLIRGKRVPIIGGIASDCLMLDLSSIKNPQIEEEVVLLGRQGKEEITSYELAKLVGSVNYQIQSAFRPRLQTEYV